MYSTGGGNGGVPLPLSLGMVATDMSQDDNVGVMGVGEACGWEKQRTQAIGSRRFGDLVVFGGGGP